MIMTFICQVNNALGKYKYLWVDCKQTVTVGGSTATIQRGKTLQACTHFNVCSLVSVYIEVLKINVQFYEDN